MDISSLGLPGWLLLVILISGIIFSVRVTVKVLRTPKLSTITIVLYLLLIWVGPWIGPIAVNYLLKRKLESQDTR